MSMKHGVARFVLGITVTLASAVLPLAGQSIPNPPSNLVATAIAYNQINLAWSDTSTNEAGFKVERSLDGTNFTQVAQVLTNTASYLNSGQFPNTTYYYRVRAYNSGGNSAFSNVAGASTLPLCDTAVIGWGDSYYGQASPPPGLSGVVAVSAGGYHSLVLKSDGTVVNWGRNDYGQATPPAGLSNVVAVSAGGWHNLALKSDGTVVGWGYNLAANPPTGLSNVVAIAAGAYFSLALKSDGTATGWGQDLYGQASPTGLSGVVAVAAGGFHSLALRSDGTVVGWGANDYGQATPPAGLSNVVAVSAGGWQSLALKSDGTVVGWGYNGAGQATPPPGLSNVVAVVASWTHSLALRAEGTVIGWGNNGTGQSNPPAGLTNVVAIGDGVHHSLALSPVPGAPPSLTPVAVSANQINLSWRNTAGTVAGFMIERAADSSGSPGAWTQIVAVAASVTNYSDTGLTTNTTYWYRMQAYNVCTNSAYSTPINVVIAPPPAPLNLIAVIADTNQVNLSWIDNSSFEAGFKIERAPDAGGSPGTWTQIATVAGSVTSYTDAGLVANATYWYRVRAYDGLGDSPYSNQASASVSGGQSITVMQWNVEAHIGNILNNNTAQARAIARIINYNQPDVLLFNEIDAEGLAMAASTAAVIDWVTDNVTYLGSQTGVTFWVAMGSRTDGYARNCAISRYPILADTSYIDGFRGLHAFRVQLDNSIQLQVYHAELRCRDFNDSCNVRQTQAQFDSDIIKSVAATNSTPYIFGGNWNEDEEAEPPVCTLSATYHPISTIRTNGNLVEFRPTTFSGDHRT
jgi:Regulator of chromosome condensation (RCC1) repeat/Endonuclease/Exonuclease/phosphatase family/Fibronectin type III domain